MKEAVVIQTKLNNTNMNGMLDSGAAYCVADLSTVEKIGYLMPQTARCKLLAQLIFLKEFPRHCLRSSNVSMYLTPVRIVIFFWVEILWLNLVVSNLILNLEKFNSATNGKIALSLNSPNRKKLHESAVVKARSDQVLSLKCDPKLALLSVHFEEGLFTSRARVVANVDGIFEITVLNTCKSDIILKTEFFGVSSDPVHPI